MLAACEDVDYLKLIGGAAGLAGGTRFMLSSFQLFWLTVLVIQPVLSVFPFAWKIRVVEGGLSKGGSLSIEL